MSYLDDVARTIRAHAPGGPGDDHDGLFRLYAVLALCKGEAVTAADVHDAWAAWMQDRDPGDGDLRPFEELDAATQAADAPFVEAIRAAARELRPRS